jgi:shikimate 5-dehydrogenase
MLINQGATAIDIWNENTQLRAPRDIMRTAAQAEIAASAAGNPAST